MAKDPPQVLKAQKCKKEKGKSLDSYQLDDFKVNAPFSVLFSTRSLFAVDTNILQETYKFLKIRNSRRKKRSNHHTSMIVEISKHSHGQFLTSPTGY
jgi:hypothetical protein